MRLFVAVYPPPEAVDDLIAQVGRLRIGEAAARGVNVRLTRRETMHVTLAFLGEVTETRLPAVCSALGQAARTWRRAAATSGPEASPVQAGPPRVRLTGGGRFGRGRFTVLWTGLAGEVDALRAVSATIRRELKRARLPYDDKPFRPHLTIARPGDRVDQETVTFDLSVLAGYLGPTWPVTEMVLMRSHLGPRPTYDRLDAWPL